METEKLLKLLKENKVIFVIIGATAFPIHGYIRATLDIDIFIKPTKKNAENTLNALSEFGYDMADVSIEDILKKKILIRQYILQTDIHPFVKGVSFEQVWKHKIRKKFGKIYVNFASLDDLILMKKSADRPKDRADLVYLKEIKNTKKNKKYL